VFGCTISQYTLGEFMPLKFLEPVSSAMADRLRNPIYGTFILTWLASNWSRLFLVFFSEEKAEVRVAQFWAAIDLWNGLFFPVIVTACLLLVMPWLAALLEFANTKSKNWRVDLRIDHRKHEVSREKGLAADEWELTRIKNGNAEYEDLVSAKDSIENELAEVKTELEQFKKLGPSAEQLKLNFNEQTEEFNQFAEKTDEIITSLFEDIALINALIESGHPAESKIESLLQKKQDIFRLIIKYRGGKNWGIF
jgi:hypothetical protein